MGAYQVKPSDTELAELLTRAEAGEEIELAKDGAVVAKIIPFHSANKLAAETKHLQNIAAVPQPRPYGLNLLGLQQDGLAWLDEPLDEETQRAFGMID